MHTPVVPSLAVGLVAGLVLAQPFMAQPAFAQDYPSRPVTLIVPYNPGGVTDLTARTLAERLQEELGQPVVVANRPGGSGAIGVSLAAGATPDGYTLLLATSAEGAIAPALRDDLPYDMDTDLVPITLVNDTPIVVIASIDSGFASIADLVAAGQEREIPFSSPSVGSIQHIVGAAMAFESGAEFLHLAYQGGNPAAMAVASGEVEMGVMTITAVTPLIASGQVVPLAVAGRERTPVLPDVPTLIESGLDLTGSVWIGLYAPAGTPETVVATVNAAMGEVLADPAIAERFAASGAVPMWSTPEELTAFRQAETEQSRIVIEAAGITVD